MNMKSEAQEALSLINKCDRLPNMIVMDGTRDQVKGEFRRKNNEVGINVNKTEPHSQFANTSEGAIRELKKGFGRDMVREKSPKVLWDHCLEQQANVRSNTDHSIYGLDCQVLETMVSGETADILTFTEYKWYEWVMFWDTSVSFPEDYMVLGQYLSPALDIGPFMTRKIPKKNGEIVYQYKVRSLTPYETADPIRIKERDEFDVSVKAAFVKLPTEEDLAGDPDYKNPDLDPYDN